MLAPNRSVVVPAGLGLPIGCVDQGVVEASKSTKDMDLSAPRGATRRCGTGSADGHVVGCAVGAVGDGRAKHRPAGSPGGELGDDGNRRVAPGPIGGVDTNTRPGVLASPWAPTITVSPNARQEEPSALTSPTPPILEPGENADVPPAILGRGIEVQHNGARPTQGVRGADRAYARSDRRREARRIDFGFWSNIGGIRSTH